MAAVLPGACCAYGSPGHTGVGLGHHLEPPRRRNDASGLSIGTPCSLPPTGPAPDSDFETEYLLGSAVGSEWLVAFRAMILVLKFATVRRTVGVELVRKAHMDFLAWEESGHAFSVRQSGEFSLSHFFPESSGCELGINPIPLA